MIVKGQSCTLFQGHLFSVYLVVIALSEIVHCEITLHLHQYSKVQEMYFVAPKWRYYLTEFPNTNTKAHTLRWKIFHIQLLVFIMKDKDLSRLYQKHQFECKNKLHTNMKENQMSVQGASIVKQVSVQS